MHGRAPIANARRGDTTGAHAPGRGPDRTGMPRRGIPVFFRVSAPVATEIDRLWALRGLDEQRVAAEAALAALPAERRALDQRIAAERAKLEDQKARTHAVQAARRKLEQEIEALQAEERRFQGQTAAVKTNAEYSALLHEIAGVKEKRSNVETEVLLRMDDEERFARERPDLERALATAEAEAAQRRTAIDAREAEARSRIAALDAERATHLEELPAALRSRYERIRSSCEGRAVVAIAKGACGGCYRGQPPQVLQEARRRDRVLVCEGCGRLLVWPPDGEAA